jgi:hypothetical protein
VSRGVAGAVVGVAVPLILLQGRGEAEVAATKGGFLSRIQLFHTVPISIWPLGHKH